VHTRGDELKLYLVATNLAAQRCVGGGPFCLVSIPLRLTRLRWLSIAFLQQGRGRVSIGVRFLGFAQDKHKRARKRVWGAVVFLEHGLSYRKLYYAFECLGLVRFPGFLFAYKYVYRFVHRYYNRQFILWSNPIPQVTNKHSTQ
jgi:hypothetical protein